MVTVLKVSGNTVEERGPGDPGTISQGKHTRIRVEGARRENGAWRDPHLGQSQDEERLLRQ